MTATLLSFSDLHPPLNQQQVQVESERCLFCYDAPCMQACPTTIDIPGFIRRLQNQNRKGAALQILDANIFGGTCARVCPVEVLCEQVCVRQKIDGQPVKIGQLQRYATDLLLEQPDTLKKELTHTTTTDKKIAVVGAGPAGLSCAYYLARHGHTVDIFEAKPLPGGLNEYGLAPYKMTHHFAQREIDFIKSLGGMQIRYGQKLGEQIALQTLRERYDAVFLAMGLSGVRKIEWSLSSGETDKTKGREHAVDFIAAVRQGRPVFNGEKPQEVVVIGGGSTAIDAAIQAKILGARNVTIVYRSSLEQMSATKVEQNLAQTQGVRILCGLVPVGIETHPSGHLSGVVFAHANQPDKRLHLSADWVLQAIGQILLPTWQDTLTPLRIDKGKIWVDAHQQTSLPGVFAGGDASLHQADLTVHAVQDGKRAAQSIHQWLGVKHG